MADNLLRKSTEYGELGLRGKSGNKWVERKEWRKKRFIISKEP